MFWACQDLLERLGLRVCYDGVSGASGAAGGSSAGADSAAGGASSSSSVAGGDTGSSAIDGAGPSGEADATASTGSPSSDALGQSPGSFSDALSAAKAEAQAHTSANAPAGAPGAAPSSLGHDGLRGFDATERGVAAAAPNNDKAATDARAAAMQAAADREATRSVESMAAGRAADRNSVPGYATAAPATSLGRQAYDAVKDLDVTVNGTSRNVLGTLGINSYQDAVGTASAGVFSGISTVQSAGAAVAGANPTTRAAMGFALGAHGAAVKGIVSATDGREVGKNLGTAAGTIAGYAYAGAIGAGSLRGAAYGLAGGWVGALAGALSAVPSARYRPRLRGTRRSPAHSVPISKASTPTHRPIDAREGG